MSIRWNQSNAHSIRFQEVRNIVFKSVFKILFGSLPAGMLLLLVVLHSFVCILLSLDPRHDRVLQWVDANDRVFVGTGLAGSSSVVAMIQGRGAGGAFLNADITNAANITSIAEPAAQGGVSAIVVDNVSVQAQASSIYFTTLATSNNCGTGTFCAVKVTQAGLQ